MKQLVSVLRPALLANLALAAVCCGLYPLIVFAIGQLGFRGKANGSLIVDRQGVVRGSEWIGQTFTNAAYFHSRPSAAGAGYDAAASGGSNLGPTSRDLRDAIALRVAACRAENGFGAGAVVPADAVTASGSGLDPHISPEYARLQVRRVAAARGLPVSAVAALVDRLEEPPQFGVLGDARVNVLRLNLALDETNTSR
jgi:potassium-transporting ATPase KdpC subunit